jgi:uncharacterized protein YggU (UPF0235/DUF167 family)
MAYKALRKILRQMELPIVDNRLRVKVKPGARKSEVLKVENGVAHLAIAAQPEDGKANAEVERFLTRFVGRKATIKAGFTSKEKSVLFD